MIFVDFFCYFIDGHKTLNFKDKIRKSVVECLSLFFCLTDCGSLPDPVHGKVYVPVTTYNSYALYLCQEGYHIEGAQNRRCMATGKWSDENPICEQTGLFKYGYIFVLKYLHFFKIYLLFLYAS